MRRTRRGIVEWCWASRCRTICAPRSSSRRSSNEGGRAVGSSGSERCSTPTGAVKAGFQRSSQHLSDGGVARWVSAGNRGLHGRCEGRCARRDDRRAGKEARSRRSGPRSPKVLRARTRRSRSEWHPQLARGGSVRLAGCDLSASPRCRAGCLSFAEAEEIAIYKAQGFGVREIARQVGRDPSTISRELRRNTSHPTGLVGLSGHFRPVMACRSTSQKAQGGQARSE